MNIFPGQEFSQKLLKSPTSEYDVTYMWLWNEAISRELIDKELAEYKKAGINSLYFVPLPKDFRPDTMRTFLSPEYMTEEFLDIAEYAVKRAIELGMKPWLYDEGGWPSGGACGLTLRQNPSAKLKFLEKRSVLLKCGESFKPSEGFVALFKEKERLPDDYTASSDITVTEYRLIEQVFNGNRVDYTDESVVDTFINNTYEKYKERLGDLFGDELPVIFTDEPGLTQNSIASDEFDLFIKRFGYDLRDYLYVIEDSGSLCKTEAEVKARIDHGVLLGELIKKYAFEKISKWCEKANIHLTGHLDADNRPWGGLAVATFSPLDALRSFQIPGIDVIWEQIRYPYGGRAVLDDETLGFGFFPSMASSAARQCGRNVTLSESLSIFGDGLTHNEMRYVTNFQIIRGINAMNYAALPIGKTRASYLWARPSLRPEKPGFFNLREMNEYCARLSYLARLGYAEGDTALYMPCRDFWADPETLNKSNTAFKALGTELEAKCIPFDIIDDAGIMAAEDTGDGLRLGDAVYRHIAVAENKYMPDDVKKKIKPYLGCGSPVYKAKSDKLRFMTRKLESSRLWFVFNEGEDNVCEQLDINCGKKSTELMPVTEECTGKTSPSAPFPAVILRFIS